MSSAICGKESTETSRSLVTRDYGIANGRVLDRRRWTKASPCCAITGETTRTATWSKDAWCSWPSNNDSWCCAIRPTTWSKDRARANSRCCVWCSACWSPTTSRRNLKQQFFERAVRFIRFWLGIDCRMTRHFVNFVTYVAASGEPKAAPKPVPGPPSGDPPSGTCWAHVPTIFDARFKWFLLWLLSKRKLNWNP